MAEAPLPTAPLLHTEKITDELGLPTRYFMRQWDLQRGLNTEIAGIVDLTARVLVLEAEMDAVELLASDNASDILVNAADIIDLEDINLIAGTGLSGGGDLSGPDRTFDLEDTAVTPGAYTTADITVDQQGRITAAADGAGGGGGGTTFKGARVKKTAGQAISAATPTVVSFNTEDYDTDNFHDNATNNTRITIPVGITRARLVASLDTSSTSSGHVQAWISKNGGAFPGESLTGFDGSYAGSKGVQVDTGVIEVTAGDYFELYVNFAAGITLDATSATWFAVEDAPGGSGGVLAGGSASQALTKIDATDFNTQWTTIDNAFVGSEPADATILKDVDIGISVQDWDADLDTYAGTPLTVGELSQLQQIGIVTISAAQWGYLGSFNQELTVTSNVNFDAITGSGILSVDDTTDSSGTLTGSIHTDGGLGVVKKAYFGNDIHMPSTNKFYFDGGINTYITERIADTIAFYTGGVHRFEVDSAGNFVVKTGNFSIPATNLLYLDGGGDTYFYERAPNTVTLYTGGSKKWEIDSGGNSLVFIGLSITYNTTDSTSVTTGSGQFRGGLGVTKNIIGGALVKSGAGITGARPAPQGAGSMWFDTTLGIPIWHDGTNWVDATGATV